MFELKNKHIFIVEDDINNRVVFQMALTISGAHVSFERWGKDALFQLNRLRNVNLIVLDLMLANGVSGFDIFSQIRQYPQYATVPIVAVSAMEPSVAIPKAMAIGLNGFISKPIDETLFPQQLATILDGKMVWDDGLTRVF